MKTKVHNISELEITQVACRFCERHVNLNVLPFHEFLCEKAKKADNNEFEKPKNSTRKSSKLEKISPSTSNISQNSNDCLFRTSKSSRRSASVRPTRH